MTKCDVNAILCLYLIFENRITTRLVGESKLTFYVGFDVPINQKMEETMLEQEREHWLEDYHQFIDIEGIDEDDYSFEEYLRDISDDIKYDYYLRGGAIYD